MLGAVCVSSMMARLINPSGAPREPPAMSRRYPSGRLGADTAQLRNVEEEVLTHAVAGRDDTDCESFGCDPLMVGLWQNGLSQTVTLNERTPRAGRWRSTVWTATAKARRNVSIRRRCG